MTDHFFGDTPEGRRKAKQLLAISWVKYLTQLIAFFVSPFIILFFEDRWIGLAGFTAIVAVCILDVLPQMVRVAGEDTLELSDSDRAFDLLCMSAPLFGAALLLFERGELQNVGAFIWIIGHLFDLGSPPRIEKIST